MASVISILVAIMSVLLTFYLANRLTLNDSMDSKSGWRKELMDIASKDEITLADIYRIRASVRYYPYPYSKTNQLSFRWMSSLIINLCDRYFVEVYKDKKAGTNNGGQNIIIIQSAINSSRQFRRHLTNSTVTVLPENDEIVRIICRYLLKYHWEARQKMRIFRRGRDLMNIDDDEPSEAAARTIQLILEQVDKMSDEPKKTDIKNIIDEALGKIERHETKRNYFKDKIHAFVWISVAILILSIAYKIIGLDKVTIKCSKIFFELVNNSSSWHNVFCNFVAIVLLAILILLIMCVFCNCYSSTKKKNADKNSTKDAEKNSEEE